MPNEVLPVGTPCAVGTCDATGVCIGAETALLERTPEEQYSWFGMDVALDGDRLAVGAANSAVGAATQAGRVVMFERAGASWAQVAELVASDPSTGDWFGSKVALDGDTLLVAAPYNGPNGSIYSFEYDGAAWSQRQQIRQAGATLLGTALALRDERAIVGDQYGTFQSTTDGGAFVLERAADRTWTVVATLVGSSTLQLGHSADLEADRALIGSLWDYNAEGLECGSARLFERASDGTWFESAALYPPPNTSAIDFDASGASVVLDGDRAFAGSQYASNSVTPNMGAIVVHQRGADGAWSPPTAILEATPSVGGGLGRTMTLVGGRLLVPSLDSDTNAGRLSVFRELGDGVWHQIARFETPDAGINSGMTVNAVSGGFAIAAQGDEAVVGYPALPDRAGGVYIYDLTGL